MTKEQNFDPKTEAGRSKLKLFANTIRALAMDGVQAANSGHPGLPMGMADVAAVLWSRHLKHNPKDPHWADRDRFVLSAGHGSMLLYSLLHLSGYDLGIEDLKNFRQWESRTPGHPEHGMTPGVETTTGPLGQGISNAVGMAMAERWLATRFNHSGEAVVDHFTYVIASDGEMMEGVSHEACSLAGHLKLSKLIVLYDDNHISIDGDTALSFSEDVLKRYAAYGWHVQHADGHDMLSIDAAIEKARSETERPSIIAMRTEIGHGSPNRAGTAKVHGEPLGEEELRLSKQQIGWDPDAYFYVPEEMKTYTKLSVANGQNYQSEWEKRFAAFRRGNPDLAKEFENTMSGALPDGWDDNLPDFKGDKPQATRASSGTVLDALCRNIPNLIGGSADLTGSNKTKAKAARNIGPEDFSGNYIHYGVREHGMAAIMNGMVLHGGIRPFGGTFLVFSDYCRGSLRLSALMNQPVIYVFTHDSIGLGEDGPTHQPVEHLTALRVIPNLAVIRPADATETVEAWRVALRRNDGPTALVLTRQKLPVLDRNQPNVAAVESVGKGAYVLQAVENPRVILIGTGSELHIAIAAAKILAEKQVSAQVVSMPCDYLFDKQPESYRNSVLPPEVKARVSVEAGATLGWHKYVGDCGEIVGFDHFGASAPYEQIYQNFGLTPEAVAEAALRSLQKAGE